MLAGAIVIGGYGNRSSRASLSAQSPGMKHSIHYWLHHPAGIYIQAGWRGLIIVVFKVRSVLQYSSSLTVGTEMKNQLKTPENK
jgi:hypothetical protein